MLRSIDSSTMGRGMHGWLDSRFHFSFAEYYNPHNIHFGVLRVWNDDIVLPGTGFDLHPHENMEIFSYVLEGELSHADSMGNEHTLTRGQVQYMSAGTGVMHSEYNLGKAPLRFFQIWILPDRVGHAPNYGEQRFAWEDRVNTWLSIARDVNNTDSDAPIAMHQDANICATFLDTGNMLPLKVEHDRQAYLVVAEGKASVNGIDLHARDAMEIIGEDVVVESVEDAHLVVIEMARSQ